MSGQVRLALHGAPNEVGIGVTGVLHLTNARCKGFGIKVSSATKALMGLLALAFSKKHDFLQRSLGNSFRTAFKTLPCDACTPSLVDGEVPREIRWLF